MEAAIQPASKMRVQRFAIGEKRYFPILQGPEMGLRGWSRGVPTQKKHVDPSKKTLFCYTKICRGRQAG